MAAADTPPVGGPPEDGADLNGAAGNRRNMGLIFSLLVIAALLIVTALMLRSWRSTGTRNDDRAHPTVSPGAAGGGVAPAPGP